MLRDPVPVVAEAVGGLDQVAAGAQRLGRGLAGPDVDEIKHGKTHGPRLQRRTNAFPEPGRCSTLPARSPSRRAGRIGQGRVTP